MTLDRLDISARLLMPKDAARALGVTTDTLRRWGDAGRIAYETTAGGHRRYSAAEVARVRGEGPLLPLLAGVPLEHGRAAPVRPLPSLRELEFPEAESTVDEEPKWRFRLVLADLQEYDDLQMTLGLAGMPDAGFASGGGLQFADFEVEAPSFGEAVGRMIDAVEGIAGAPRVLTVERLGVLARREG